MREHRTVRPGGQGDGGPDRNRFGSIPSDLGVYLLREAAGGELGKTIMAVRWASGGWQQHHRQWNQPDGKAAKQDPGITASWEIRTP